jgi:predicted esterase
MNKFDLLRGCAAFALYYTTVATAALGATFTVTPTSAVPQIVDGATMNVKAGDTVRVTAGTYQHLVFRNMPGTTAKPITITNYNGLADCANSASTAAVTLQNCRSVRLNGSGNSGVVNGFRLSCTAPGGLGLEVQGDTGDIIVNNIEVAQTAGAGVRIYNAPSAAGTYNRGTYLMKRIALINSLIHHTGGPGIEIGHPAYNGLEIGGVLYYPHLISDLKVRNNVIEDTGAEGIRIASVGDNLELNYNVVRRPGPGADGISVLASTGKVWGNTIVEAPRDALRVVTQGNTLVGSNVAVRPGRLGVLVDDFAVTPESLAAGGSERGRGFAVLNNTVVNPGQDGTQEARFRGGIRVEAADISDTNRALNNVVIGGAGEVYGVARSSSTVRLAAASNRWYAQASSAGFTNAAGDDYSTATGSPLRNAGTGVQRYGLNFDAWQGGRTSGTKVDLGAYEFQENPASINVITGSTAGSYTTGSDVYPYRFYTPKSASADNPLPIILFCHGVGEGGTNNQDQVKSEVGPLINMAMGSKYAAYLVAPQAADGWIKGNQMAGLIQSLMPGRFIDPDRVYVTGLSAGGHATWNALGSAPTLFAAGVPLSAVWSQGMTPAIAAERIPIWAFHGDDDTVVAESQTRWMVDDLIARGALPRYTMRSGWGHNNWSKIYSESSGWTNTYTLGDPADTTMQLHAWLFNQSKTPALAEAPPPLAPGRTLLLDFGGTTYLTPTPDAQGRTWNNLTSIGTGTKLAQSRDSAGTLTSTGLAVDDAFSGTNDGGVASSALYPATAARDSWFVGAGTREDGLLAPGILRLTGLVPGGLYRLRILPSRGGTDGTMSRMGRYTVAGQSRDLDATDNSTQTALFEEVAASAQGELSLKVEISPDSNGRYAYLNVLELSALAGAAGSYSQWAYQQGLDPAIPAPDADDDGDNVPNRFEFLAGRDPLVKEAAAVAPLRIIPGTPYTLEVPCDPALATGTVVIWRALELGGAWEEYAFRDLASPTAELGLERLGNKLVLPLPGGQSHAYFKLGYEPEP